MIWTLMLSEHVRKSTISPSKVTLKDLSFALKAFFAARWSKIRSP